MKRSERGFTLLELLVVVMVVGIMAGLTVMSVGGNVEREFRRDVARMQQQLDMAQDEAPFAGKELGFWIAPDGKSYRFLAFDSEALEWKPFEEEGFAGRNFPEQYRVQLEVDGAPVDLAALYREMYKLDELPPGDEAPAIPWLVFFSDGHYTPFSIWFRHPYVKDSVYVLEGDGLGDIHMRAAEARQMPEPADD